MILLNPETNVIFVHADLKTMFEINQLNLTSVFKWDLDLFTGDPADSIHGSDREHVRPADR